MPFAPQVADPQQPTKEPDVPATPHPSTPRRLAAVVAALLLAASALFAIGVGLEHAHPHHDAASAQPAAHTKVGETGPESAHTDSDADGGKEHPVANRETGEHAASETVLGTKAESPGAVAAVVAASVLLAAAIWRRPSTGLCTLVALFTAAAAVFDIAEIHHQTREGTVTVAAIAAAVAALHTATFLITAKTVAATRSKRPRTA